MQFAIRELSPISVDVIGAKRIEGRLIWQDLEFLVFERFPASARILIGRRQICVIGILGLNHGM